MNELEQKIKKLHQNYPMTSDALHWYEGKHCSRCGTFVGHKPYGFENGWDSALKTVLNFFKK